MWEGWAACSDEQIHHWWEAPSRSAGMQIGGELTSKGGERRRGSEQGAGSLRRYAGGMSEMTGD